MARMFDLQVRGLDKLIKNLGTLGRRLPVAIEGALFEVGEDIVGDAKELAPVDLGTLKNSGFVLTQSLRSFGPAAAPSGGAAALARTTPREVVAVVGFGGPATPYALIQHERTDFHHRVGQAKYLEVPLQRHAGTVTKRIAARLEREVQRVAR